MKWLYAHFVYEIYKILPKIWLKPSAKSFGLKPSATEAEGQKTSASAEDFRPLVDPCL